MFIVLTYFWLRRVLLHIWLSFTIHYFIFHFKRCSIIYCISQYASFYAGLSCIRMAAASAAEPVCEDVDVSFCIFDCHFFTIHYFIFHFKCYSNLHFAVCQLLCWAFSFHWIVRNESAHQFYKYDTNWITNSKMADKMAAVHVYGCISSVYISFQVL